MQAPRVRCHDDIVRRIQGEFLEMPGLRLTEPQARRLWALEPSLCSAVLTELIDDVATTSKGIENNITKEPRSH